MRIHKVSLLIISLTLLISSFNSELMPTYTEEKLYKKLQRVDHESEAISLLNEAIYQNVKFTNLDTVRILLQNNLLRAAKLLLDFAVDSSISTISNPILEEMISAYSERLKGIKAFLKDKKKNIVRISPIFEWSQDNELVKIRLKFAKNLESPGEKDISNFKVDCERAHLKVQGYKVHEDYVAYYYRRIHLYDFIKTYSCKGYKETDGTYIVKFEKNQATLYWNFLDQPTEDHSNMYTWFDVFTAYDSKAKYTEFREMAQNNLLMSDLEDYVKDKKADQKIRTTKIENIMNYLKTRDYENKNFCNSPINTNYCLLDNINDWNYWLF
jgi:hypothetical protein